MKYRFLCAIYFLGLEKDNMTISLPSGKISNEKGLLKQTFDNILSVGTLGVHSIDEFYDASAYYVVDGEFADALTKEDCDACGTQVTFALLRQIQSFIGNLWKLRDICAYVRDGFLYAYDKNLEKGCT